MSRYDVDGIPEGWTDGPEECSICGGKMNIGGFWHAAKFIFYCSACAYQGSGLAALFADAVMDKPNPA